MTILEKIHSEMTYFEGGMGTLLQAAGLQPGELPELWNLDPAKKEIVIGIHKDYLAAGADIIKVNTFGANYIKFPDKLEEIIAGAIDNARQAIGDKKDKYIAYDMGPCGKMLKPLGDYDFEDAVKLFAENARLAKKYGADLILIETMNDSYEAKAAVLAAKENTDLPIFVTCVYDERAKLMTGASPEAMVATLEGLGVDAIGLNCSLGPAQMIGIVPRLVAAASVPVIVCPNAGLPRTENGVTVYDVDAEEFSEIMIQIQKHGATILGGCCGTNPEFIKATVDKTKGLAFTDNTTKNHTVVSSYTNAVYVSDEPVLIGERINPTGKKTFKQALRDNNIDYILNEGVKQQEAGAHILDVNVGLPEIDEVKMMETVVTELQAVSDLPLQLDTTDPVAMERGMRLYNGKPMVNSVNGKEEVMAEIFPLVKKYGGVVIALTIDEGGIPDNAQGRFEIAKKIVEKAKEYGIDKKDIVVDPLCMTVSSDGNAGNVTLEAIKLIKEGLGVRTSLGISNVSFGLPNRDFVTSTFYCMALMAGLDCAIMNPFSVEMMKIYKSFCALRGIDENCTDYIEFASTVTTANTTATGNGAAGATGAGGASSASAGSNNDQDPLTYAIIKGLKDKARAVSKEHCATTDPLVVINEQIIPALDIVGKGFEEKTVFLPQLLMAAEAAKEAFESVKESMADNNGPAKGKIILATVKGDIHDIGKNIVKVLLSNYGYEVLDLGKDVEPETIVKCALENDIKLVGLSALMTTTVPAMEETIKQLHESGSNAKVVVGGAVLTQEYADMIKADKYAKDAMETVRYAEELFA